jgi:hypothetical protein
MLFLLGVVVGVAGYAAVTHKEKVVEVVKKVVEWVKSLRKKDDAKK